MEFKFSLKDQPIIKVELMDGTIKELKADDILLLLFKEGINTSEMAGSPDLVMKVVDIVSTNLGVPVGPMLAMSLLTMVLKVMGEFRKKAESIVGSEPTTDSGETSGTKAPP